MKIPVKVSRIPATQLNPTVNGKKLRNDCPDFASGVISLCLACYKETTGIGTTKVKCAWCVGKAWGVSVV